MRTAAVRSLTIVLVALASLTLLGAQKAGAPPRLFFVDGALAGRISERLEPKRFTLGAAEADYRDLLIYRPALNADQAGALEGGQLLPASLEVYSPLTERTFKSGGEVSNLAQSLTSAKIGAGSVQHIDK